MKHKKEKFIKDGKVRHLISRKIGVIALVPGMKKYDAAEYELASKGFVLDDGTWDYRKNWQVIKTRVTKGTEMEDARWGIRYGRDVVYNGKKKDNIEFFPNIFKAKAQIEKLLNASGITRGSIVLFKLAKKQTVTRNISYHAI